MKTNRLISSQIGVDPSSINNIFAFNRFLALVTSRSVHAVAIRHLENERNHQNN
jgi:hypothetical protein